MPAFQATEVLVAAVVELATSATDVAEANVVSDVGVKFKEPLVAPATRVPDVLTASPVPLSATVEFPPLVVNVRDAAAAPAAVGVKDTLVVQYAPAARLAAQLVVVPYIEAFAPDSAMEPSVIEVLPTLVKTTARVLVVSPTFVSENPRVAVDKDGTAKRPVPLKANEVGLFTAELVTVKDAPVRVCATVGAY